MAFFLSRTMKLVFATHNKNKLLEIRDLFYSNTEQPSNTKDNNSIVISQSGKFEILGLFDVGVSEEIPENHLTIEENASEKSWYVYNRLGSHTFADDTGLEVEALKGEPGVHSARYAGIQKNAQDNMDKVLTNLRHIRNRKAQFRTVISLIFKGKEIRFEGIVKGRILGEKRGTKGFGYDPIFVPEGFKQTFAEMDLREKNKISHRSLAFQKLIQYLHDV